MESRNKSPVISVIVPVYNVEQYLIQCIDSILDQTFPDFELLLIDDGSTDGSGMICDEYRLKDNRVVVIHQNNAGASGARNRGLDIAKGKYIAFVDGDDLIRADYLESLYSATIADNAEIAMCRRFHFQDGDEIALSVPTGMPVYVSMTGREATKLRYKGNFCIAPGEKLIARYLFDKNRFPVGRACEDQAVIPYVIYEAIKLCITDEEMYYYRIRSESLSHGIFKIEMFDNVCHMNDFINFLELNREHEMVKDAIKLRDETLASYTIQAHHYHIKNRPEGCHMNKLKALSILRKRLSNDRFLWQLSLVHPSWVKPYQYYHKLESVLTGKPL